MGPKLFVVALPIGNVDDISSRAKRVLAEVDVIACEDTRKLKQTLSRIGVVSPARFLVYNKDNEKNSAKGLLDLLAQAKQIALVSDAGTPKISDPGHSLVEACWNENIEVEAIPGASALTAVMSICPFAGTPLLFLGFLPPKTGKREKVLHNYAGFKGAVLLFESVHRIEKTLAGIHKVWGNPLVFIARELSKTHQEHFLGTVSDALQGVPGKRGEFTIVVQKADSPVSRAEKS